MDSINHSDDDCKVLEQLRGVVHSKKRLCPPSQNSLDRVNAAWDRFKAKKEKLFNQLDSKLDVSMYKLFFKWYTENSTGSWFGPRPSLNTMLHNIGLFKTKLGLSQEDSKDIQGYIIELYNKLGLKDDCHSKRLLQIADMELLLEHLWCRDTHTFSHERYRLQLAFYIQIMAYTASRPGAIIVSGAYAKSNQTLQYKDFQLILLRPSAGDPDPDRTPRLKLTITFHFLKGMRQNPSQFLKMTLRDNRECPLRCPITIFSGLAFADDAFEHFRHLNDLLSYTLPEDRFSLDITFKSKLLQTPVLRMAEGRRISATKGWTCRSSGEMLGRLSLRAGFEFRVSPYDVRRGSSNILNGIPVAEIATEAERNQVLGQKDPKVFRRNYLSKHVRIDLQGFYADGVGRNDDIDHLLSQKITQRRDAPSHVPREIITEEVRHNPQIAILIKRRNEAWKTLNRAASEIPSRNKCFDYKANRAAVLESIEVDIQDGAKRAEAVQAFHNAYDAHRSLRVYKAALSVKRFRAYREGWFKQANAKDALSP